MGVGVVGVLVRNTKPFVIYLECANGDRVSCDFPFLKKSIHERLSIDRSRKVKKNRGEGILASSMDCTVSYVQQIGRAHV